jgi:hypothetical protein
LTVSGSARSTGALPLRERCDWHPETAGSPSGESVGGPRRLLVGRPSVRRLRKKVRRPAAQSARRALPTRHRLLRQPRHGSLLPSCAGVKKAQGNRGPVMPTGTTARRKLQTGNGEQSSRHGGALRKRHAASACSLRAGGTHRSDRLIPFGVSSKPGFSGASRAGETINGFGPVDPATGRCSA